jgi:hypothetical protein
MVRISVATDEFGGVVCTLADEKHSGTARASNAKEAMADLLGAVDNASNKGSGECFWLRESGQYRWLIRRHDQHTARMVVLWSAGTMTGWENVFWADCEWQPLEKALREGIAQYDLEAGEA